MGLALVVMGVSGCGKSTVAQGIAERCAARWIDADDLHSPDSVAKMRAGVPLTDADRWPWLDRVGAALADRLASPDSVVVACSALRRAYRDRLRTACAPLRFVFLDGDRALIQARLSGRTHHYMPGALLDSQFATLERPGAQEPDVLRLDIAAPVPQLIDAAVAWLRTGSGGSTAG